MNINQSDAVNRFLEYAVNVDDWGCALPKGHHLEKTIYGHGIDSFTRINKVLALFSDSDNASGPTTIDRMRVLGDAWTSCDNLGLHRDDIAKILRGAGATARREMMTQKERAAWKVLPVEFTIWRGCHSFNANGLSWSLDESVARRFPLLHRYRASGRPILLQAIVKRNDVVLKMGRGEAEIIAMPRRNDVIRTPLTDR